MTDDLADRLKASNEAQGIIQDMTEEALILIKRINDLYNTPGDKDLFVAAFHSHARLTASFTDLNRVCRYDF